MATLCAIQVVFTFMTTVSIAAEEPSVEHTRDVFHTTLSQNFCRYNFFRILSPDLVRVLGLLIRDCTRDCNNCDHTRPQLSAID